MNSGMNPNPPVNPAYGRTFSHVTTADVEPSYIRVMVNYLNEVTLHVGTHSVKIHVRGNTADETIDLLIERLQAAKTTETKEGE